MKILAIESSCDETAASVVENGRNVLSNVVASQIDSHIVFGGVVPEIASRMHTEAISGVVKKALDDACCSIDDIDAIAVTYAPGLIGALLVGVNFAKGLAYSSGKPLIPVHHLRSHIAANYLSHNDLEPEFLALVVSGGHTHLIAVEDYTKYKILGHTLDDAAGECMDKAARAMGLDYPGGVNLDLISKTGNPKAYNLPKPKIDGCEYNFSFSGLKTAVINTLHNCNQKNIEVSIPDLGASCIDTVTDYLIEKTLKASHDYSLHKIVIAGGVSANSVLRRKLEETCLSNNKKLFLPELKYCGDNAAMVGAQAYYEYKTNVLSNLDLNAFATMPIDKLIY